jgi:hypothetical protein
MNQSVLRLLFTFGHWHGLAKLRMHTDTTLAILDDETTNLGKQLRAFQAESSNYATRELKRESEARQRRRASALGSKSLVNADPNDRRPKQFNLQTYKTHALGDYVASIKQYGTTDSYTTAVASIPQYTIPRETNICST